MDTIVKWFTLAIVMVFDPLAVALVLAYNSLIQKSNSGETATIKTPEFGGNRFKRLKQAIAKYRD